MAIKTKPIERPLSALDVIYSRRSVRSYTGAPLEPDTVKSLLDAAVQAPTALHAEPWTFVVVQDAAALKRISNVAKSQWSAELSQHPDFHADGDERSHFAQAMADPEFSIFYDAGTLIVICAPAGAPFATADCWLAADNLMLAACAMGLGSCCIGSASGALNTPAIKSELHIPADVVAVAPVIVGVPRGAAASASRRSPLILSWLARR